MSRTVTLRPTTCITQPRAELPRYHDIAQQMQSTNADGGYAHSLLVHEHDCHIWWAVLCQKLSARPAADSRVFGRTGHKREVPLSFRERFKQSTSLSTAGKTICIALDVDASVDSQCICHETGAHLKRYSAAHGVSIWSISSSNQRTDYVARFSTGVPGTWNVCSMLAPSPRWLWQSPAPRFRA